MDTLPTKCGVWGTLGTCVIHTFMSLYNRGLTFWKMQVLFDTNLENSSNQVVCVHCLAQIVRSEFKCHVFLLIFVVLICSH